MFLATLVRARQCLFTRSTVLMIWCCQRLELRVRLRFMSTGLVHGLSDDVRRGQVDWEVFLCFLWTEVVLWRGVRRCDRHV
ncbi:hypothetical protein BD289DRAFT_438773 [Coniella lustricola]|uniref:Uncharacterized protein n=1 Tax=Coniella lustricola TaxID=2025994 RepID=A0A2T3A2F0_9PEZI|nr:hypothetical protein BD289DRAFT_438773 [Coniella lustricola]